MGVSGQGIGGFNSDCYVKGSVDTPLITVAVVDSTGTYTYSFPCSKASEVWPGIECNSIADELQASPATTPDSSPCSDPGKFCAVFNPWSQATTTAELADQNSFAPNDRGFCSNFLLNNFEETQEPWGSTPAVLGGKTMPWNTEMECGGISGPLGALST